jgi:hypothetical protein
MIQDLPNSFWSIPSFKTSFPYIHGIKYFKNVERVGEYFAEGHGGVLLLH